jgi:transposase
MMTASTILSEQQSKNATQGEEQLDILRSENGRLHSENERLKEQLEWFRRQIFGQRSERIVADLNEQQPSLPGFEMPGQPISPIPPPPKPKPKPRKPSGKDAIELPPDMPEEEIVLDLPDNEKICPKTGKPLVKIGEDVTRKLCHRRGAYFIKKIIRPKYASLQDPDQGIATAALPDTLLPRCQADESLLAKLLTEKFAYHMPLYRISEKLASDGIKISRQTLSQWVLRSGQALKPIYEELKKQIFQSGNIFIDETPLDMLEPGQGKVHQAYMWVVAGGKEANPANRLYTFHLDRKHIHAEKLLLGYNQIVHSDKYGAYEALANKKQFTWCPCWAHIRRKFFEAESGDPPFREWVLSKINEVFALDKKAWNKGEEERMRIRREHEIPIIDELIERIKNRLHLGGILPKSKFREALCYFCGLIPHLKNYTFHPYARLDNNPAERAIRALAIGRKNWLFVGNEQGGEAAAVILSLVQTCRALEINPQDYLEDVMRRLMSHNSKKLHELLPNQWSKEQSIVIPVTPISVH